MPSNSMFKIGAPGVDTEKIVAEVQAEVARKMDRGVYNDARVARAERTNLVHLRNDEQFLTFYLKCLRDAVYIDISDFEIRERRRLFAPLLVALKRSIWKLLKFYTYRLWSQQNQVNGLMVTAIEGLEEKYAGRIKALERRVNDLEKQLARKG